MNQFNLKSVASNAEIENRQVLAKLLINSPIPEAEKVANSALFLKRQELSKILFLNHIYQQIVETHGIIIEFGVRWGQNLVTLSNLRGIYEPFNYSRKIVGFDTFTGFVNVHESDGKHPAVSEGAFSVTDGYESYLQNILAAHQQESPLSHISKFEICKGDAPYELKKYLERHPETIISFAYFDFDIYKPTKDCLELVIPLMPKGSIIGFDEVLDPDFPGESVAFKEVCTVRSFRIYRNPFGGIQSYIRLE